MVSENLTKKDVVAVTEDQYPADEPLSILFEVCSVWNLPKVDVIGSCDPFVLVYLMSSNPKVKSERIHETAVLRNTSIAIYTVLTDCFGLFEKTPADLRNNYRCIRFRVKDSDRIGKDDAIGNVDIPIEDLLGGMLDEERKTFRINLEGDLKKFDDGVEEKSKVLGVMAYTTLALRFRVATDEDKEFMDIISKNNRKAFTSYGDRFLKALKLDKKKELTIHSEKKTQVSKFESEAHRMKFIDAINTRRKKQKQFSATDLERKDGVITHEVYPSPPQRLNINQYLTSDEIYSESLKPSYVWEDAGTGSAGIMFLEVLGCDKLPNLDAYTFGKTDAYIVCCYEDVWVQTDVVPGCLNPNWMPWSKRAFAFRVNNFNSALFIGVFDRDASEFDDFIGHIIIKPSKFVSSTEYTLTYELKKSMSFPGNEPEKDNGRVRLRMRIEIESKSLLSTLQLMPSTFVNTSREGINDVLDKTCHGIGLSPTQTVKRSILFACKDELQDFLLHLIVYMFHGCVNIIFWRGHIDVIIPVWDRCENCDKVDMNESKPLLSERKETKGVKIKVPFPYNSILLFLWGICLAENPYLMPSFLLFLIPWILLAQKYEASKHPSPWHQPQSFKSILLPLFNVKSNFSLAPTSETEKREINMELKRKNEERERKVQELLDWLKQMAEFRGHVTRATLLQVDEIDTTKKKGGLLAFLLPAQMIVCDVVTFTRFSKQFLRWDFPHSCLLICLAGLTFSLLLAVISPIFPYIWAWTFRIVVWIFLGPQMGLFYIIKENMRKKEIDEATVKSNELKVANARTLKESAEKMKAMFQIRYGKFVKTVSSFRACRVDHFPLSIESEAKPFKPFILDSVTKRRISSTHLKGAMIPVEAKVDARLNLFRKLFGGAVISKVTFEFSFKDLLLHGDTPLEGNCFFQILHEDEGDKLLYLSETVSFKDVHWKRGTINVKQLSSNHAVRLKIEIYSDQQFIGAVSTTLQDLVKCTLCSIEKNEGNVGTLVPEYTAISSVLNEENTEDGLTVYEENHSDVNLFKFHIIGEKLKNVEGVFRKSDPFYTIELHPGTDKEMLVYTSKVFRNNLNPHWTANSFPLDSIHNIYDTILRIKVFDHERDGNHVLIGFIELTIREFVEAQHSDGLYLRNDRGKSKRLGKLVVLDVKVGGSSTGGNNVPEDFQNKIDFGKSDVQSKGGISTDMPFMGRKEDGECGDIENKKDDDECIEIVHQIGEGDVDNLRELPNVESAQPNNIMSMESYFQLKLIGYKLTNVEEGIFTKSDPFYEIYSLNDSSKLVYKSNVVRNNLNPVWEQVNLNLSELCGGDVNQPMLIKVYDWESDLDHVLIGTMEVSVSELLAKQVLLKKGEKKPKDDTKAFHLHIEGSNRSRGRIFVTLASLV